MLTLVERKTGFTIIKKITSKTISEVNKACLSAINKNPAKSHSITFDNGLEIMGYNELEIKGNIKCYFANPFHAWERGTSENLNGLVRQYIPKGSCMKVVSQRDCNAIAKELNSRTRKRYGYKAPKELFYDI